MGKEAHSEHPPNPRVDGAAVIRGRGFENVTKLNRKAAMHGNLGVHIANLTGKQKSSMTMKTMKDTFK